jgi:ABC-2 type transport system permease protein
MNNILIVIFVFYVLLSFLLAYVSSILAKSRNQSRALWFWLTLIFPIAIVFIAFKDKQAFKSNYSKKNDVQSENNFNVFVSLWTLTIKEVRRFLRIWVQTLVPPAVTMSLYFVIFGSLIGPRIGSMDGFDYIQYMIPGLIMLSVITNSYNNVVSSFYAVKFQKSIEELLISPMPNWTILLGFVLGGVSRGVLIGIIVFGVSLLFYPDFTVANPVLTITVLFLTSVLFSLMGFINAVFADSFDDISIIPTFILTPLIYLGGVFYSINILPDVWRSISMANPMLYVVNTFREGMLGVSDVSIPFSLGMIITFILVLSVSCLYLLKKGTGIRQ